MEWSRELSELFCMGEKKKKCSSCPMLFPVRKRGWLLTQWLRLIWSEAHVTMTTQRDQSQFCERQPSLCQPPPHKNLADPQAVLHHPKHVWASPSFRYPLHGQTGPSRLMSPCLEQYRKKEISGKGEWRTAGHFMLVIHIPCIHWFPSEHIFLCESLSICISK